MLQSKKWRIHKTFSFVVFAMQKKWHTIQRWDFKLDKLGFSLCYKSKLMQMLKI